MPSAVMFRPTSRLTSAALMPSDAAVWRGLMASTSQGEAHAKMHNTLLSSRNDH